MRSSFELRPVRLWIVIGAAVLAGGYPAYAQHVSFAELFANLPSELAAEVERQMAKGAAAAPQVSASQRAAALEQLRSRRVTSEPVSAQAEGSVTATARCKEGYVTRTAHSVNAPGVEIVAEQSIDCDAGGCRALQVTARQEAGAPFQLQVFVTCSS